MQHGPKRPALRNQSPYKGHGQSIPSDLSTASPSLSLHTAHILPGQASDKLSSQIYSFSSPQLLQISSLPQSFPRTVLYKWQRHPHSTPVLPLPSEPCLLLYGTYGDMGEPTAVVSTVTAHRVGVYVTDNSAGLLSVSPLNHLS